MEEGWQRHKILIWGMTRPEISKKYREIVCTGGVLEETRRLIRLYPIPLRYMDSEKTFKKYQWIEAYILKSTSDSRPESYKIRADGITVLHRISTEKGKWLERASWVVSDKNVFASVEVLQDEQEQNGTSLGLVKPLKVIAIAAEPYSKKEKDDFWADYHRALEQMDLPIDEDTGRTRKPLAPPDFRFKIAFRCNDERCKTDHHFSVLDWECDALYFKLKLTGESPKNAAAKVVDKIRNQICADDKDLYFFLGNISNHLQVFTIVGFWWPKKGTEKANAKQPELFEAL